MKNLIRVLWLVLVLGTGGLCAAQSGDWKALNEEAVSLYRQGNYSRAIAVAQSALQLAEAELGAEHPHVATNLNNLATLHKAQGQYAQAAPLLLRSLAIRIRCWAPTTRMWPAT